MKLKIVSPDGTLFDEAVDGFVINTNRGQQTVLDDHIDFLSFFDHSEIVILSNSVPDPIFLSHGYLHLFQNEANVIAHLVTTNEEKAQEFTARLEQSREHRHG
ncbi:F0F1 ATP synthase subunit epsilon [Listeria kieliensis]|uniref:ATP synthase F1 subunit epsilon n=1 Tax=Listeria kieliensis TaxID=1621700 RepID=A0A3D8TQE3_9LIST|nr:F0F1 ATP synthase subunit epsilon [Listeria kieliensis]RDX00917.1 ATP synthase F1 subunit epsilon [Listeria kieliensis]